MKRFVAIATTMMMTLGALTASAAHRRKSDDETVVERTEELNLAVGENKTISARGVKNYSEGERGIAEVRLTTDGSRFVVVGRRAGSTTLLLINKDGTQTKWVINVFSRSPDAVEREVKQLLEGTIGVRLRRVGARFFIEGGVTSKADVERMRRIAALYPGQVESLVVQGAAPLKRKVNIRIDFYFVQYSRSSNYAFGMSWPTRLGGESIKSEFSYEFLSGTVTTAQASIVNQPLPGLDIAARNGWAKVLKQSTVITANGTEAVFQSGGEQNFAISSGLSANIVPIRYGTNVKVLPRFDPEKGEIQLKLTADIADLVPPVSSTPLPGRNTSKLETLVSMKLGESLVLSGIRTQSQRKGTGGVPLLSEIPILGALFGTRTAAQEDVEGAVFVVPSVVESTSQDAAEMVTDALTQYADFSGDMDEVNSYDKRPPKPPATGSPSRGGENK